MRKYIEDENGKKNYSKRNIYMEFSRIVGWPYEAQKKTD